MLSNSYDIDNIKKESIGWISKFWLKFWYFIRNSNYFKEIHWDDLKNSNWEKNIKVDSCKLINITRNNHYKKWYWIIKKMNNYVCFNNRLKNSFTNRFWIIYLWDNKLTTLLHEEIHFYHSYLLYNNPYLYYKIVKKEDKILKEISNMFNWVDNWWLEKNIDKITKNIWAKKIWLDERLFIFDLYVIHLIIKDYYTMWINEEVVAYWTDYLLQFNFKNKTARFNFNVKWIKNKELKNILNNYTYIYKNIFNKFKY